LRNLYNVKAFEILYISERIDSFEENMGKLKRKSRFNSCFRFLFFMLILILLLSTPLPAWTKEIPKIELSPEEKAWLSDHPVIRVGGSSQFEPAFILNPDGTHTGIYPDLYDLMGTRLGVRFEIVDDKWPEVLRRAKAGEVDMVNRMARPVAERMGFLTAQSAFHFLVTAYAKKDHSFNLTRDEDIEGLRVAYTRGVVFLEKYFESMEGRIEAIPVDNALDGFKAVLGNKADVAVGWNQESYLLMKYNIQEIEPAYVFDRLQLPSATAIHPDAPLLASIMDKTLNSISPGELNRILKKWTWTSGSKPKDRRVELTPEEQTWLDNNHTVRVRVTDSPPYLYYKDGKPFGIAVDLINAVSERTGIKFHFVMPSPPFSVDLKGMIQHTGPDLISTLMPTPEREKNILFTKPYISSPRFIFTRDDAEFVASMESLSGKTVAVIKGYIVHTNLAKNYPDITLLVCKNNEDALKAVSSGKAFAFIGDLITTPAMINAFGLKNLKAVAPSSLHDRFIAMGLRNDWPELRDIINKAMVAIPNEEKAAIINKWSTVKFEHGIRTADVLKWILVVVGTVSVLVFFFVLWNRNLKKQVQERTGELKRSNESLEAEISEHKNAQNELRKGHDYLKNLTDSLGDAVFSVKMPERRIEWVNDYFKILGYDPSECIGKTTEFLYPQRKDYLALGDTMAEFSTEGKTLFNTEQILRKKSGEVFPAEITVTLFREKNELIRITGIVRDITERKNAEKALESYQMRLKALATQLTIVEEKERRRIAVDLHDHVCQSLALMRMQVASIRKNVLDSTLTAKLDDFSGTLQQTLQDTQHLMSGLSSPLVMEIGLSAAISEWLEEQVAKQHNLKTEFIDDMDEHRQNILENDVRTILFRHVRELLTNVIKHARAKKVSVRLQEEDNLVKIIINDDGTGFDPDAANINNGQARGFGLFSIKERMSDMGGTFEIFSKPGEGCKAILMLPVDERRND
jgi:PAS domain S-box-containing protein